MERGYEVLWEMSFSPFFQKIWMRKGYGVLQEMLLCPKKSVHCSFQIIKRFDFFSYIAFTMSRHSVYSYVSRKIKTFYNFGMKGMSIWINICLNPYHIH